MDLELVIAIASFAHRGQLDKGGSPYILHPLRVMLAVPAVLAYQMAAVLHDVVEDTVITLDNLRESDLPGRVVDAVDCLTKREGQSYEEYLECVAKDEIARIVKLADLRDNSNLSRILNSSFKDIARVAKYRKAIEFLLQYRGVS